MDAETVITTSARAVPARNRVPEWVMPAVTAGTVIVDACLTIGCFLLAFVLRQDQPVLSTTAWAWSKEFVPYAGILYFAVFARIALLAYLRVYRFGGAFSYLQEAIKVFEAVLVGSLLIVSWAFLFRGGFAFREFSYSRSVFVLDFAVSLVVFTLVHLGLRYAQAFVRSRGINLIPTLIVGTDAEAIQTVNELSERTYLGYRVIGIVRSNNDTDDDVLQMESGSSFPIIGHVDDLAELIQAYRIQEVIITDNSFESERLFEAMMQLGRAQRVEFRYAPNLFNMLPQKTDIDQIGVLPMIRLFREPLSETQRFVKRISDLALALLAGLITAPIWILTFILIKSDSRGPVIFKQERVGMDGRLFLCYKFRSMYTDADESLHRDAYIKNIEGDDAANSGDVDKPVFGKVKDDPRITRIGKWLRRTSIDELPQILNVIRGDMSIVGPRPPIPYEVEEYDIHHRKRLDMKPGITGLWQVSGRNRLTFEDMVRVDLYYIENWSLFLDLKIIFLTLPAVFRGEGAR